MVGEKEMEGVWAGAGGEGEEDMEGGGDTVPV